MQKTPEKKFLSGSKLKFLVFVWLFAMLYSISLAYDFFTNEIGYQPNQKVSFSHKQHSGDFEIRCLYCHSGAEFSEYSPIPTTYTCMVCHIALKNESELLKNLNFSFDSLAPLEYKRLYKLPDFTHFNHAAHINALIDCSSCHGEIEKSDSNSTFVNMTMSWCLDCHRNPREYIVPAREVSGIFTYNLDFINGGSIKLAEEMPSTYPQYGDFINLSNVSHLKGVYLPRLPSLGPEHCSACHF